MNIVCLVFGILAILGSPVGLGLLFGPAALAVGMWQSSVRDGETHSGKSSGAFFGDVRHRRWLGILLGIGGFGLSLQSPFLLQLLGNYGEWRNRPAPDFTVVDLNETVHHLKDYRGRRVFLVFWSTTCPPCVEEVPHLNSLIESLSEENFQILAFSFDPPGWLEKAVKKKGIRYPVISLSEPFNRLSPPYSEVRVLPTLMVVSPDGKFEYLHVGYLPESKLRKLANGEG